MKINAVEITKHDLTLCRPLNNAKRSYHVRSLIHLQLSTDEGHVALGEAAPLAGFNPEHVDDALRYLQTSFGTPEVFSRESFQSVASISAFLDHHKAAGSARHALEQALLRLCAQVGQAEPATLLSNNAQRSIPVHQLITTTAQAKDAIAAGHTTLKVKVGGRPWAEDLISLRAIRDSVGQGVDLRLDANGAWNLPQAVQALPDLDALGVRFFEQPLGVENFGEMRELRGSNRTRWIADESIACAQQLEQIIDAEAFDAVALRPMVLGGPIATIQIANSAVAAGLDCSIVSSIESPVGRSVLLDVASALPKDKLLTCGVDTVRLFENNFNSLGPVRNGQLARPIPNSDLHDKVHP